MVTRAPGPSEDSIDLAILGAGPSGWLLAEACARRGVNLRLIGPEPERPWTNNYGLWLDDAEQLGLAHALARRWPSTEVVLAGRTIDLQRGYARLDNNRLRTTLAIPDHATIDDLAETIEHERDASVVRCASGRSIRARLVVDTTGHGSRFIAREAGPGPAFQIAWGEVRRLAQPRESYGSMCFMDWSAHGPDDDGLPPSFLYRMPFDERSVFVEETLLVARPPCEPGQWLAPLRRRLHQRLAGSPLADAEPVELERCIIPMGGPLPLLDQRTLAFGGSAGFVHPATGYMLTQTLRRRERVAAAIATALASAPAARSPFDAPRASARVWRAIWTPAELRAWRLYTFGMAVLLELDRAGIEQFFTEFFALPPTRWRTFLSANAPIASLVSTMLRYYVAAPRAIKARLSAHLFGSDGFRMVRGFM